MNHELWSSHRPSGPDLLRIARQTFETVLLPALDGELRYTALMVRRALAICEREWRDSPPRDPQPTNLPMAQVFSREADPRDDPPSEAAWVALVQAVQARLVVDAGVDPGADL